MPKAVSTEQLKHYRCDRHNFWWACGDGPDHVPCPYCERERADSAQRIAHSRLMEASYWESRAREAERNLKDRDSTQVTIPAWAAHIASDSLHDEPDPAGGGDPDVAEAARVFREALSPGEWVCQRCGENVPAAWVTYQETHEGCGGKCQ